ncbi:Aldose reductase-related protein 2, partial [Taenia solium]
RGQQNWLLDDEHVVEAARKHKKRPAQVLQRQGLRRGIVVMVRGVTAELIISYIDVFDFDFSSMEMVKVGGIEWSGPRFWNPDAVHLLMVPSDVRISCMILVAFYCNDHDN